MKLYFLRHGIADAPEGYQGSDFERPLTDEGCRRMAAEAKTIAKLKLELDAIITSPLKRAKQTASIVADELKMKEELVEDERLGPAFDTEALASLLRDNTNAQAIMLVGHDPSMTETIGALVGGAKIDFKKGGVACVDVPEPSSLRGELLWLAPPKLLIKT